MLEKFLRRRASIQRLRGGLLGPHLDSFVATLATWAMFPFPG
jgi:hypothetical protein